MRERNQGKEILKAIAVGAAAASAVVVAAGWDYRIAAPVYKVKSPKIEKAFRMVQLSDLHSCMYGRQQEKLLAVIEKQEPDLIVMTGDMADDDVPHKGTLLLLQGLWGKYPSYYVTGNHEFWSGEVLWLKEVFSSFDVTVLGNEWRTLEVKGQRITVCGVDDTANRMSVRSNLAEAFQGIDTELFTVLLAHRPEKNQAYLEFPADLIVSGHAHGGQWRVPGLINGLFAPSEGLFPKYAGGLYDHGHAIQIVSRGLAKESTKVPRLYNRPEVVVIDVEPGEELSGSQKR